MIPTYGLTHIALAVRGERGEAGKRGSREEAGEVLARGMLARGIRDVPSTTGPLPHHAHRGDGGRRRRRSSRRVPALHCPQPRRQLHRSGRAGRRCLPPCRRPRPCARRLRAARRPPTPARHRRPRRRVDLGQPRSAAVGQLLETLTAAGFNWVSIDYRLGPLARLRDAVDDVAAAIAFVRCQAATLRADPDRLVLLGEDAGAHLARTGRGARPADLRPACSSAAPTICASSAVHEREADGPAASGLAGARRPRADRARPRDSRQRRH